MYVNSYLYPAQNEALIVLVISTALLFLYFIIKFERDAVINWNPFGTYTPSEINPRCGYHNVRTNSEFAFGFDILSMLTPLKFQESFP